jgi:peptidyl-prolyl cis-trans isomerase SurA
MDPVGWRLSTELSAATLALVQPTATGRLTEPRQIGTGIELVAVCARRSIAIDDALRASVGNTLFNDQATRVDDTLLRQLRQRAVIRILI